MPPRIGGRTLRAGRERARSWPPGHPARREGAPGRAACPDEPPGFRQAARRGHAFPKSRSRSRRSLTAFGMTGGRRGRPPLPHSPAASRQRGVGTGRPRMRPRRTDECTNTSRPSRERAGRVVRATPHRASPRACGTPAKHLRAAARALGRRWGVRHAGRQGRPCMKGASRSCDIPHCVRDDKGEVGRQAQPAALRLSIRRSAQKRLPQMSIAESGDPSLRSG